MASLGSLIGDILGENPPVAVRTWEGDTVGPPGAPATVVVRSPEALVRVVQAPGQLGLGRAYVAGDLDIEGDIFAVLDLPGAVGGISLSPRQWAQLAQILGRRALRRLPPPPVERRLHGTRHSSARDREAISHHYDVSNDFYRLILGPSMTYSCAVWREGPGVTLEAAQEAKHELVCSKLDLSPGQRLLDVGCGWATMIRYAAASRDVSAVGVTISARQREWATRAIAEDGMSGRVAVRLQDYRDIDDGPFDAVCSIGMSEHVGRSRLHTYFSRLYELVRPGGRVLNHAISALPHWRPPVPALRVATELPRRSGFARRSFMDRYVFPDGELIEVGEVVSAMQRVGFEVRHVESLREHYGLTLRRWVANLEQGWDAAVAAAGIQRARAWRLYMAASARSFETGRTGIHQVLAVKPDCGRSGFPLRPRFD